jgi:hypothetical protein
VHPAAERAAIGRVRRRRVRARGGKGHRLRAWSGPGPPPARSRRLPGDECRGSFRRVGRAPARSAGHDWRSLDRCSVPVLRPERRPGHGPGRARCRSARAGVGTG